MPDFFLNSLWRRPIKPKISTTTNPIASHDKGTAVEVVSKVNGGVDVPTIVWAVAPTEKNTSITMPVKMRARLFIVKVFLLPAPAGRNSQVRVR